MSRPTTNAPKPNTRFLRNIIKETDTHNTALRAKEAQDAKSRLRRLQNEQLDRAKTNKRPKEVEVADRHSKRRRLDQRPDKDREHHSESHHHRKSKRCDDHKEDKRSHRYHTHSLRNNEEQDESTRHHRHRHRNHHHSHRSHSRSVSEEKDVREYQSRGSKSKRRLAPLEEDRNHAHKRRRRRERSASSSTPDARTQPTIIENGPRKDKQHTRRTDQNGSSAGPDQSQQSDSDPLESLVGPLPPPPPAKIQSRGRGKFASSSAMDSHFSSMYDPAQDIHPNSDSENDWDQALEALRDRQRWKQQGAERLRLAGFTEEEVGKWEKGGEKREEDVRWNAKGEGREWDRGKVVGEDEIETRAEWGRLKGT